MAAIAMVVKKRQDEAKPLAALNDKRHALEQEGADAFAKARPSWKEVRKQLEMKGVDTNMSSDREKELHDILAQPAFTSMLVRTQHTVRQNILYPARLHRFNLAERLCFESQVFHIAITLEGVCGAPADSASVSTQIFAGTLRLLIFILVFWMFWAALILSSNVEVQRGIYESLDSSFNFAALRQIKTREAFVSELMPLVSLKSKDFFLLSSRYFKPSDDMARGSSSVQLLGQTQRFTRPFIGPVFTLRVPRYSFTVWVKPKSQFVRGYVLRKSPVASGYGAELSCWGIHLDKYIGPTFRYAAHEYFPLTRPGEVITENQVRVAMNGTVPIELEQMFLLTVIITPTEVTFFRNLERLGEPIPLTVPVTDCFNNDQGVLIGDAGLELSGLRFYPQVLTPTAIEELYVSGGLLADLSRGTVPPEQRSSETAALGTYVTNAFASVESSVAGVPDQAGVGYILNAVEDSQRKNNFEVNFRSPAAPIGRQVVNLTKHADETGKLYTSLYRDAARLTSTSSLSDDEQRYFDGIPDFNGTGIMLSWWHRHIPCLGATCGLYLFEIKGNHTAAAPMCTSVWIENDGHWYDNPEVGGFYPRWYLDPKYRYDNEFNWRHSAWVWDETDNTVKVYMDGNLASTTDWGSLVRDFGNCAEPGQKDFGYGEGGRPNQKILTWGRITPGYRYGAEVETYDLRMYVHSDNGGPLSEAAIKAIASGSAPGIDQRYRCLAKDDPAMSDTTWRDAHDHGCSWYHDKRKSFPTVCAYEQANKNCPIACRARQECFTGHRERPPVWFVWDNIRRIEQRKVDQGTLCLGNHLNAREVYEQCKTWVQTGEYGSGPADTSFPAEARSSISKWFGTYTETLGAGNPRLNLTACEDLREAIDEYCTFNISAVREFTAASAANNKDFTMAMWVRPSGTSSLHKESRRFFPGVSYYGTLSPPQHQISWGQNLNPNGEVRVFTPCAYSGQFAFENIEMKSADDSDWTFLSISRRSSDSGTRVVTSGAENYEAGNMPMCYYDDGSSGSPASFFNSIEINQPMLISPIMLVPKALPFSTVQELYYGQVKEMSVRFGPQVSKQEREVESKIQIEKEDFSPRSTLLSAPIIFQTRRNPSDQCPYNFSTEFLHSSHDKVVQEVCAAPFECSQEIMAHPEKTLACPGNESETWREFSLDPLEFGSEVGYGDILYSISDNPFLFRNGRITDTHTFIDSMSGTVKLFLVFFSPRAGITSLFTITAEFMGEFEASVDISIDHYTILEGAPLQSYLTIQILCVVLVSVMAIDAANKVRHKLVECMPKVGGGSWKMPSGAFVFGVLVDIAVTIMTCAFISLRIPAKVISGSKTREIVGAITDIAWGSEEITLTTKKATFFGLVQQILTLISEEQSMGTFANWILLVSMLRIVQATGLHPRLGILTGTVRNALDDLMHAGVLILLVNFCLAAMGYWRFGGQREDFGNLDATFSTSLEMLLGALPEGWASNSELQLYIIIFVAIVFFLVQNFLLAIIVEAYMTVRGEYVAQETEEQFPIDVYNTFIGHAKALWYGWPLPLVLGREIEKWESRYSVTYKDLVATGLFRSHRAHGIGMFIRHYAKFDFLAAPEIRKRAPAKPGLEIVDEIERRVSNLVGKKPPTLRQMADEQLAHREERATRRALDRRAGNGDRSGASDEPLPFYGNGNGIVTTPTEVEGDAVQLPGQVETAASHELDELMKDVDGDQ